MAVVVPQPLRFTEREIVVLAKFWRGWFFSLFVMPLLFLGAMGLGLGDYVDRHTIGGLDYLTFVAPGMLAAGVMQNASGDALWGTMGGHKWLGHFNAAAASPLRPADVFTGWVVSRALVAACTSTVFLVVAAVLGGVPSWWGVLAIPSAVLLGMTTTSLLSAFSVSQDSDMSFGLIMRLVVLPMFVFSGTFFPIEQLPAGVRPLAMATPLWHAVELCRGATTGSIGFRPAVAHVGYLAACIAVGFFLGIRGFTKRLTP
jgi:lipooligosaccharide transport system permease protein